jgi:hypothetical protein
MFHFCDLVPENENTKNVDCRYMYSVVCRPSAFRHPTSQSKTGAFRRYLTGSPYSALLVWKNTLHAHTAGGGETSHHGLRVLPVPAALGWRCHGDGGAAGAGLEAGGGDVALPVAHLEPEVAEAALQDCVGTVVEGRHVAAAADPDA